MTPICLSQWWSAAISHDGSFPWDFLQAVGTGAAVAVAWYQLWKLRKDQRGWETLKMCERYDTDPLLDTALREIKKVRDANSLKTHAFNVRLDITTILNYLDGIAIGTLEGFYDERIVRDHLEEIAEGHVKEFLDPDVLANMQFTANYWPYIQRLLRQWQRKPKRTYRH